MTKKTILMALFCAGISIAAFAQEEPGAATPVEMSFGNESKIEKDVPTMELVDKFLQEKGWSKGPNKKADGSEFQIAVGYGIIEAPINNRNYPSSRVNAFDKAMLEAKKVMAKNLGRVISSQIERTVQEGGFASLVPKNVQPTDYTVLDKIQLLLHAKLDAALRAEGIDPDKAVKEAMAEALKNKLREDKFQKLVTDSAESYVSGMQAFQTFEGVRGSKREIGVVAIWSPLLQQMAEIMAFGEGNVPKGAPKKPLREQIPSNTDDLLKTFGVHQFFDEDGQLTLVSFGQAGAATDSPSSENSAYTKSEMNAAANIRQFAGENVTVISDMLSAETIEEYENAAENYENEDAFREKVSAVAQKMQISGIATLKTWEAVHPVSNRKVFGTVCIWSPKSSEAAKALRKRLSEPPRPQTGSGSASGKTNNAGNSATGGRPFSGSGISADEDAF